MSKFVNKKKLPAPSPLRSYYGSRMTNHKNRMKNIKSSGKWANKRLIQEKYRYFIEFAGLTEILVQAWSRVTELLSLVSKLQMQIPVVHSWLWILSNRDIELDYRKLQVGYKNCSK